MGPIYRMLGLSVGCIQEGMNLSEKRSAYGCDVTYASAKEAGFEVSLYVLAGIGGQTHWRQHAEGSANVLNEADPHFIRIRTYVPTPHSALWDRIREDLFEPASPETILREQGHLIQRLEVSSQYLSDHISNYAPVYGNLPEDRTEMLQIIKSALETLKKDSSYRKSLEMKRHLTRL